MFPMVMFTCLYVVVDVVALVSKQVPLARMKSLSVLHVVVIVLVGAIAMRQKPETGWLT